MKKLMMFLAATAFAALLHACSDDKGSNIVPHSGEYTIEVMRGSADSETAAPGEEVTLTHDNIDGMVFDHWLAVLPGELVIENNKFIMPGHNVDVRAMFVEEGSGGDPGDEPIVDPNNAFTYMTDLFFIEYCRKFDTNDDGILTPAECEAVTSIQLPGNESNPNKISSIAGIELFTNITQLVCQVNFLTELDLSNNTKLQSIVANLNPDLTVLNVSGLTNLQTLYCHHCSIEELDLSTNTALKNLICNTNGMIWLDVSNCTALEYLSCEDNKLTMLAPTDCHALEFLLCRNNSISSLDISNCPSMVQVLCGPQNAGILQVSISQAQLDWWAGSMAMINPNVSVITI